MLSFMGENKRLLNIHEQKFAELTTFQANTNVFQANTNASLRNPEIQVGQLALNMQNQSRDFFPSDTKKNPKDCLEVTLRIDRELQRREEDEKIMTEKEKQAETREETKLDISEMTEERRKYEVRTKQQIEKGNLNKKKEEQAYIPYIPFPQRLQKAKMEEQFSKFLKMFKKIEINIPFAKALAQMPHYTKFMKDILSKKRRFAEEGVVSLTTTCSVMIQRSLPLKMQDPGSFTIPYTIGNFEMGKALCDLGASINLMPLSVLK